MVRPRRTGSARLAQETEGYRRIVLLADSIGFGHHIKNETAAVGAGGLAHLDKERGVADGVCPYPVPVIYKRRRSPRYCT